MPIMSYEEYAKVEHGSPYILRIKRPSGSLYYFGERHSYDPSFVQWNAAKELWKEFLADDSPKKIALVEGGAREARATESESIQSDGGMGLVAFLAKRAGIELASPEPSESQERSELEKVFGRDEIQYYYFARMVYQWSRKGEGKPDFDAYLGQSLEGDKWRSGWAGYDFSIDHMRAVHEKIFGKPFSLSDPDFFIEITDPVMNASVVNAVSRQSGLIRDEHIARSVAYYLERGYSVYAQFGHSHVVMQEQWLRERFAADLAR